MSFKRITTRGAPDWLYERHLKGSVQFWIRYRKGGVHIEERLKGSNAREAAEAGQKTLGIALRTNTEGKPLAVVRSEHICDEIVALKKALSSSTHEGAEIMSRVHVKPWLNQNCPYIADFNATVWPKYKIDKRLESPTVALFNHWKFFLSFGKHAHAKGLLKERIKFDFDPDKEDFREEGLVISDDHLKRMVAAAPPVWRDRIILQRFTGMRPGEVRCLKKSRVTLSTGVIALRKEDTKTREPREFTVTSREVLEILRRRFQTPNTEFFFPARGCLEKPMAKGLKGWRALTARAGITEGYTPHDLRHTFATFEFKKTGANTALICFQLGMSIEEAQKTYLHFKAADTSAMAEDLAKESSRLLTTVIGTDLGHVN